MKIKSGDDWSFEKLQELVYEVEKLNDEKYKYDIYPNRVEIVTYEQMLDVYSKGGLAIYDNWQFGEAYIRNANLYKQNYMSLAYEVVFNSNPCVSLFMEQNSMIEQLVVYNHANYGHNYVYKNNYLFKEWTDAAAIIDYAAFARSYIRECEEKYGEPAVTRIIDAAHALRNHGLDKFKRPQKLSMEEEEKRKEERHNYIQSQITELWSNKDSKQNKSLVEEDEKFPKDPEENILYFLEKYAPKLKQWEREVLRIVRKLQQHYYPHYFCSGVHEGFATWTHYNFTLDLYKKGFIDDGAWQDFIKMHTGVINQRNHTDQINVYAFFFAIFNDIERISVNPTEEDRRWFENQDWVGNQQPIENIKYAAANFRDDSFIMQYLTPKVIRDFKLYSLTDNEKDPYFIVSEIHDDIGYKNIRDDLSKQYNFNNINPTIEIVKVDRLGDRTMYLEHKQHNSIPLDKDNMLATLEHLANLWGYQVVLKVMDQKTNRIVLECSADPNEDGELEEQNVNYSLSPVGN